jgi:hypothetical protein
MWPIRFVEGSQPGKKKKDDVQVHVGRENVSTNQVQHKIQQQNIFFKKSDITH